MLKYDKLYIGGQWIEPAIKELLEIRSPHDQSLVGRAAQASKVDVDLAVSAAKEAFVSGPWPQMEPKERQEVIARFNDLHAARSAEIAALVTAENGSPISFTSFLQPALFEQTNAYLRAAASLGWEDTLPSGV